MFVYDKPLVITRQAGKQTMVEDRFPSKVSVLQDFCRLFFGRECSDESLKCLCLCGSQQRLSGGTLATYDARKKIKKCG